MKYKIKVKNAYVGMPLYHVENTDIFYDEKGENYIVGIREFDVDNILKAAIQVKIDKEISEIRFLSNDDYIYPSPIWKNITIFDILKWRLRQIYLTIKKIINKYGR